MSVGYKTTFLYRRGPQLATVLATILMAGAYGSMGIQLSARTREKRDAEAKLRELSKATRDLARVKTQLQETRDELMETEAKLSEARGIAADLVVALESPNANIADVIARLRDL